MPAGRSRRGSPRSPPRCSTASRPTCRSKTRSHRRAARSMAFGDLCEAAYQQRVPLFAQGFYRTPDIHFDPTTGRGRPFHYFAYGAAVSEVEVDGFTGALPAAAHRHPAGRRRLDFADRRSRADRRRLHPGRRLAHDRGAAVGREGPRRHGRRVHLQAAVVVGSARRFEVEFLERATQPDVVLGSKAVGEPPLMLAISVREALRDAVAAFGERPARSPSTARRRRSASSSPFSARVRRPALMSNASCSAPPFFTRQRIHFSSTPAIAAR